MCRKYKYEDTAFNAVARRRQFFCNFKPVHIAMFFIIFSLFCGIKENVELKFEEFLDDYNHDEE